MINNLAATSQQIFSIARLTRRPIPIPGSETGHGAGMASAWPTPLSLDYSRKGRFLLVETPRAPEPYPATSAREPTCPIGYIVGYRRLYLLENK